VGNINPAKTVQPEASKENRAGRMLFSQKPKIKENQRLASSAVP
jgi:hypothetical protein